MKNLIAELLLRLAEKEEASKDLVVQIEALEIVLTAPAGCGTAPSNRQRD